MSDEAGAVQGEAPVKSGGYVPPATQEEFDRIIQERIAKAKASAAEQVRAEFKDFVPKQQLVELEQKFESTRGELAEEWRRAAVVDAGLPVGVAGRVAGSTREEIMADARALAEAFAAAGGGVAAPEEEQEPASAGEVPAGGAPVVSPRRNPVEQRGVPGGNPSASEEISTEDVLKQVKRF